MRKWIGLGLLILLACFWPVLHTAAFQSSDTMILEWRAEKVWLDKGNLCLRGTFTNKRNDLFITKLNEFETQITFTRADGSTYRFTGKPAKMPLMKISANGSRTVTFNLGSFEDSWRDWITSEEYTFTYMTGKRC